MEPVAGALAPTHITSNDLAIRWRLHPKTLANWRHLKRGPRWFRLPGSRRILYLIEDIERIERSGVPAEPAPAYEGP